MCPGKPQNHFRLQEALPVASCCHLWFWNWLRQHWLKVWSSWGLVWWRLHGQAPMEMAAAGQVKGSPFLLELLITGKQSCPHPLILSNHDNCCGAIILSPGQPPQGCSQRGLGRAAFLESLLCVRCQGLGHLEGIQHHSLQCARASQAGPGVLLTGMGQDAGATMAVGRTLGEDRSRESGCSPLASPDARVSVRQTGRGVGGRLP